MKTFFIVLLAFFFSIVPLIGQPVSDLFSKLCQVNVQWQNQTDIQPVLAHANVPQNQTPTDWIELHLLLVHQTLSLRTVNGLTQLQQENRKKLLIALKEYANSRVFPRNDYVNYQTPVFIDRKGVHCAVGFLMQQSGHETLAKRIDAEQKFAYIKEIRVPGVNEWACEHGFTLDELAWIQPGYPAVTPTADLKQGVNGTVYALAKDPFETQIFVAGDFEQTTNGLICNNIAVYQAGFAGFDWVSLGTGVNGKVFALLYHQNQLWVGGEFTAVHGLAASGYVARYDLLSGNWVATGTLDGTVRAFAVYNGDVYAGGNFTGSVARWNGSDWQTIPNNLINGEVRTLEVWNQLLVIGGNFDILTGVPRKHAIAYDGSQMVLVGNGTPTPVNDLHSH
ncbi:MAG: hypothetical protein NZ108_03325, partial [Bacteroidia bacterium]|nr:hypothetical protein [Bacteroidia bacterium]